MKVPRAYNSRMDVGVAAARVIRSRHRIAACRDMLDRVAKLMNAADDRTLRRREATPALYRAASLIAKRRVARAARTHLHQLHRRTDGIRLGLH